MANITGTSGNNNLLGTSADDIITGLDGDDVLAGLAANDTLYGGNDNDILLGGTGDDELYGGAGDDSLNGGSGADYLSGGGGFDTANYGDLDTGVVVNLLTGVGSGGAAGDTYLSIERVIGSSVGDTITGNAAANTLEGRDGNDVLLGGDGNDTLLGGAGADSLYGGAGTDTADYSDSEFGVVVRLGAYGQGGTAAGDTFSSIENITGSSRDDILTGDAGANRLRGGGGFDVLAGLGGADILEGYAASYAESDAAVQVDLTLATQSGGHAQGDVLIDVRKLIGSAFSDQLRGSSNPNDLIGGAGNDILDGREGGDTLIGGAGADVLIGGLGSDTADYSTSSAGVTVDLVAGVATGGDAEGDQLVSIEHLTGSNHDDVLVLGANATGNLVYLDGGSGYDVLTGGDGSQWITGGTGADVMTGGAGPDNFIFRPGDSPSGEYDRILDFQNDRLTIFGTYEARVVRQGSSSMVSFFSDGAGGYVNNVLVDGLVQGGSFSHDSVQAVKVIMIGDDQADTLTGASNDDQLFGGLGDDVLSGGESADLLVGGAGADTLDGGQWIDTADYSNSLAGVTVSLAGDAGSGGDAEGDTLVNIERLTGSAFADVLIGSSASDEYLDGGAGDDRLISGAGADFLIGNDGIDTADYSASSGSITIDVQNQIASGGHANGDQFSSIEWFIGTAFGDSLSGSNGAHQDILEGGGGSDILNGRAGADILIGGEGADQIDGGTGIDTADYSTSDAAVSINLASGSAMGGHAQWDVLTSIERLVGSAFADTLAGSAGSDFLVGGSGNDILSGGASADSLDGGDGLDTVTYAGAASGVSVDLSLGAGSMGDAEGDLLMSVESLIGTSYADTLIGSIGDDTLAGGGGDDILRGGLGADSLIGGAGADLLEGQDGNDLLNGGSGDDVLNGMIGDDVLLGGAGVDELNGGQGSDTLQGGEDGDTLRGGDGDDSLNGGAGADVLNGGAGSDTATYRGATEAIVVNLATGVGSGGWAQGDTFVSIENLYGSNRADTLTGDDAGNRLDGGAGDDLVEGALGDDVLLGNGGDDQLNGGDGLDNLIGGSGTDILRGAAGDDVLNGGAGADLLQGGNDNDTLNGGSENDTLQGGSGDDVLNGGSGNDQMNGGSGSDRFEIGGGWGQDRIADFAAGAGLGDVIAFADTVFANFSDVLAATADDGLGNCVITKGSNTLTLTGVTRAQLNADDFLFEPVGGAATGAGEIAPAPMLADLDVFDPLILPLGLDSKASPDELPVVCPPGQDLTAPERPWIDLAELGLSSFDGRDPHRALMEPRGLDWIV